MKKWYLSKTLWIAFIGFVWILLQSFEIVKSPLTAEVEAMILTVIMFILRIVTNEPVEWQKKE